MKIQSLLSANCCKVIQLLPSSLTTYPSLIVPWMWEPQSPVSGRPLMRCCLMFLVCVRLSDVKMLIWQTILILDEVIHMLAAVRDAAAADAYIALLPSNSTGDNDAVTSQRPASAAAHSNQQQQPRRRVTPRPSSVASVDHRDPEET